MIETADFDAFESDFRKLFLKHSKGDYLTDFVVIASAVDPKQDGVYTTIIVPAGQRPPLTAGLVRMGVVVSDRMLDYSTVELIDMEDDEDDEEDR